MLIAPAQKGTQHLQSTFLQTQTIFPYAFQAAELFSITISGKENIRSPSGPGGNWQVWLTFRNAVQTSLRQGEIYSLIRACAHTVACSDTNTQLATHLQAPPHLCTSQSHAACYFMRPQTCPVHPPV